MNRIIKYTLLLIVIFGLTIFAVRFDTDYRKKQVMQIGLNKGQNDYFQQQLKETGKQYEYIKRGYKYLDQENFDRAIGTFQEALKNAYSQGTKAEAYNGLANAFEKKKDYNKALEYVIIIRDEHVNDWAKAPVAMRVKYLEYAAKGECDLAVKATDEALAVEASMPYNKGVPSKRYVQRVNDLKASKEYIESLKK